MMLFVLILISVTAFISGFHFGGLDKPQKPKRIPQYDSESLKQKKEYENFLNYDGNEQS